MIRFDCQQGTEEWKAARLGIPTASCFSSILAVNKTGKSEAAERRNYRARLIVERLTGKPVNGYESAAMQQGREREAGAREAYEIATGNVVQTIGFIRHDTLAAGCSPDGLVGERGGLEIKCPELAAHLDYLRLPQGCAPSKYEAQIHGQMWIAELDWIDFVSWNPDFPPNLQMVLRRVKRDDKCVASLQFAVGLFLEELAAEESELRKIAA